MTEGSKGAASRPHTTELIPRLIGGRKDLEELFEMGTCYKAEGKRATHDQVPHGGVEASFAPTKRAYRVMSTDGACGQTGLFKCRV